MSPQARAACAHALAPLTLPDLHLVLHTAGITVGKRHPQAHTAPELHSPVALRQMAQLQHLPPPTFYIDATPQPHVVATRAINILDRKVFHVQPVHAQSV